MHSARPKKFRVVPRTVPRGSAKGRLPRGQAGQVIFPLTFVVIVILGLIGVTLAGVGYVQSLTAGQRAFAEKARQTARAGVEDALIRIVRDQTWPTSLPHTYSVSMDPQSPGADTAIVTVADSSTMSPARTRRTITATSTVRAVLRQLRVEVEITGDGVVTVQSREELVN